MKWRSPNMGNWSNGRLGTISVTHILGHFLSHLRIIHSCPNYWHVAFFCDRHQLFSHTRIHCPYSASSMLHNNYLYLKCMAYMIIIHWHSSPLISRGGTCKILPFTQIRLNTLARRPTKIKIFGNELWKKSEEILQIFDRFFQVKKKPWKKLKLNWISDVSPIVN